MKQWIRTYCRFCGEELEEYKFFPPNCECDRYKAARDVWLEEYKSDPSYEPPLEPEEFEKKYPQTFSGERLVLDKEGSHKLNLEARKYKDGEGLTVSIPFVNEESDDAAGLCFDFSDRDAQALYDLLGEYFAELRKEECLE